MRLRQRLRSFKEKPLGEKLFFLGGVILLGLAVVGIFLPVVPQVPFAIAAAYCFSKSSPQFHHWVRHNKHLGKPVTDWEDHRVVRPKLKAFSTAAMVVGAVIGHWILEKVEWAIALDVIFAACIVFVLTRRSRKPRTT